MTAGFLPIPKGSQNCNRLRKETSLQLTAEEAETFEEVITDKITVHSKSVLALFDSGASYCYISDTFITLHSIPIECLDNQ